MVFSTAGSIAPRTAAQISFGTTNLQLEERVRRSGEAANIYFLPLGSGPALTDDITGTVGTGGFNFGQYLSVFTLQMVDQTNPISAKGSQLFPTTGGTTSLNIAGTAPGSMIIENFLLFNNLPPMPESGQTEIRSKSRSDEPFITFLSSPGGDVNLEWSFPPPGVFGGVHAAVAFAASAAVPPPVVSAAPIPTMSEWGLLIFGLLILNLGIFFVQRSELA